ncbi:MAG: type III-B CRISPR module-associated protein Cmr3 [Spirochaetales bacterium]|nr:type III-B CRISPR module-associated protein Cmr3 [Spirochaetales bacterium]
MYIKLTPHDFLFFRDGKPYTSGEDAWANTNLMPNPSVLWGAVASLFMASGNDRDILENRLKLKKISLYNEDNSCIYLPAPRDIYADDNNNRNIYYEEYMDNDENHLSSLDIPCYVKAVTERKTESGGNLLMDISSLYNEYYYRYCITNMIPFTSVALPDYKIGITRDKATHTSEEGKLYRIDVMQFQKDWSILLEIESNHLKIPDKEGFLKLGGESKVAGYKIMQEVPYYIKQYNEEAKAVYKEHNPSFIKIYFTTPAIFEKEGWKPVNNDGITLLAASVGKAVPVGGFDMKKNKPKPMYRAVPPGSVYLYATKGNTTLEQSIKAIECSLYYNKGFGAFEALPFYGVRTP